MQNQRGMLTPEALREMADSGGIDTVVLAFTDHYGRPHGKRYDVDYLATPTTEELDEAFSAAAAAAYDADDTLFLFYYSGHADEQGLHIAGEVYPWDRLKAAVRDVPAEDLGRIIDVNLKAPIILTRLALPYLEEAGGGAIINVASLHGRLASAGATTYSSSKFGLRIFTLALRQELEGSNIKVAVISPGPVDTGFIMENLDEVDDIVFSQPMSSAEEVGQAILDLCGNNIAEQAMPTSSGTLTTLAYLMPSLGKWLKPMLLKKGARVKARLIAERKRRESDFPGR